MKKVKFNISPPDEFPLGKLFSIRLLRQTIRLHLPRWAKRTSPVVSLPGKLSLPLAFVWWGVTLLCTPLHSLEPQKEKRCKHLDTWNPQRKTSSAGNTRLNATNRFLPPVEVGAIFKWWQPIWTPQVSFASTWSTLPSPSRCNKHGRP